MQRRASDGARAVLIAAACALATYSVASMLKLIRTYDEDEDFIYRRDVPDLREIKATRELGCLPRGRRPRGRR